MGDGQWPGGCLVLWCYELPLLSQVFMWIIGIEHWIIIIVIVIACVGIIGLLGHDMVYIGLFFILEYYGSQVLLLAELLFLVWKPHIHIIVVIILWSHFLIGGLCLAVLLAWLKLPQAPFLILLGNDRGEPLELWRHPYAPALQHLLNAHLGLLQLCAVPSPLFIIVVAICIHVGIGGVVGGVLAGFIVPDAGVLFVRVLALAGGIGVTLLDYNVFILVEDRTGFTGLLGYLWNHRHVGLSLDRREVELILRHVDGLHINHLRAI